MAAIVLWPEDRMVLASTLASRTPYPPEGPSFLPPHPPKKAFFLRRWIRRKYTWV